MARRSDPLSIEQILRWADEEHRSSGRWPTSADGLVAAAPEERWSTLACAIYEGNRGLPGAITLPQLLDRERGVRNKKNLPKLTDRIILGWADSYRRRTGDWPTKESGTINDSPLDSWQRIDDALKSGYRGLPGGGSLAMLLMQHRRRRHIRHQPPLTVAQILHWADAHYRRSGTWPSQVSGSVRGVRHEDWANIHSALVYGRRGLPGGDTLPRFLARLRSRHYQRKGGTLTTAQIVRWAKAHFKRCGSWPTNRSGIVIDAPDETWSNLNNVLEQGLRGMPGGHTLAEYLFIHAGARSVQHQPPLTRQMILKWADAHHAQTGKWPNSQSGAVTGAPDESWNSLDKALTFQRRTLRGALTLARLLVMERGHRHKHMVPRLSITWVMQSADHHFARTGDWPTHNSGPVLDSPGETWCAFGQALQLGRRGLPGGMTLAQLLAKHRGRYNRLNPPPLTHKKILEWADAHYERTGDWPSRFTGRLIEERHETWSKINFALVRGSRGLRRRTSLVGLLSLHRMPMYRRKGIPIKPSAILAWAAEHHELMGALPTRDSGEVIGEPGETWRAIDASLRSQSRGLRGGTSLRDFLQKHYTPEYAGVGKRLTVERICAWAESFYNRVGRWPTKKSAYTDPSRTEKWATIDMALRMGTRSLAGGSSLAKIVADYRRRRAIASR